MKGMKCLTTFGKFWETYFIHQEITKYFMVPPSKSIKNCSHDQTFWQRMDILIMTATSDTDRVREDKHIYKWLQIMRRKERKKIEIFSKTYFSFSLCMCAWLLIAVVIFTCMVHARPANSSMVFLARLLAGRYGLCDMDSSNTHAD